MTYAKNAKVLNDMQKIEINFWKSLFDSFDSKDDYMEYRKNDVKKYDFLFKELKKEKGSGLDYGCGLVSMLEGHGIDFEAYDLLMNEYNGIVKLDKKYIKKLSDKYNWIWCINMIDHDECYSNITDDFKKLLKKKGKIFLEVNFDDNLSPAHAKLWRIEDVREAMGKFKLIKENIHRLNQDCQYIYQGIYEV